MSIVKSLWCRRTLSGLVVVFAVAAVWLLLKSNVFHKKIRNIILISIDTCRADYLSCYGFERKTTPNIDSVAAESTVFKNAVSSVPITLPAHSSMLTGTIPPYHNVRDNVFYKLGESNITLAEILKDYGFTTAAIVSAFVMDSQFGIAQGFDTFNDRFEELHMAVSVSERKGHEASRLAMEWLEQHKKEKFFLFLHYFDPHLPYEPPEPFASQFADNPYAGEIAYVDYCIAQVIQKLKDVGLYDSSLIIITGDHGEMLGERGELTHGYFIYQSAVRVPLIFKMPQQHNPQEIKQVVGLIDIVPTICSLLGIRAPANIHGKDLSGCLSVVSPSNPLKKGKSDGERFVYCESMSPKKADAAVLFGLVTDNWKYIQTTRPELYDLAQDPMELNNLVNQQPQRAGLLKERLKEILAQAVRKDKSDSRMVLDEQSRQRLASLGYVGGSVAEEFEFDQTGDDPKDLIDFYLLNGKVQDLTALKKFDEAKKLCEEASVKYPDSYRIYRCLSMLALGQGDMENAKAYMLEGLRLNPKQADLRNNLAIMAAKQGRTDEAVAHLTEAIRLEPAQIITRNNLAMLLVKQGEYEKAVACLTESLRIKYDQPEVHFNLGDIFYQLGRFDEAVKYWSQSLEFAPPKPYFIHNRLAAAFHKLRRLDDAIEHWEQSLKMEPQQPAIKDALAAALAEKSKER